MSGKRKQCIGGPFLGTCMDVTRHCSYGACLVKFVEFEGMRHLLARRDGIIGDVASPGFVTVLACREAAAAATAAAECKTLHV